MRDYELICQEGVGVKVITVSGAESGAGKTTVAERLLKGLKGWSALKVTTIKEGPCPRETPCGICEEQDAQFTIVADNHILNQRGKDTQRMRTAGAREVLWLKARPSALKKGIKAALKKFKHTRGVVIEGTSVLKYLKPDLAIFVRGKGATLKPSAKAVIKKVDLILTV